MLYCPRRKRTGARLLVAARVHSRINGLADECVEHILCLLDRASAGFSRPVQPPVNTGPEAVFIEDKGKAAGFRMADGFAVRALPARRGNGEDSRCAG